MKRDTERKKYHAAPLHIKKRHVSAHLSEDLRKVIGARAMTVVKGDKVRVMRGKLRGQEKVVAKVDYSNRCIYLEGVTNKNARGEERLVKFQPSNVMLIELKITDGREKKYPNIGKAKTVKPAAKPKPQTNEKKAKDKEVKSAEGVEEKPKVEEQPKKAESTEKEKKAASEDKKQGE